MSMLGESTSPQPDAKPDLPTFLTSFIGRGQELARTQGLLVSTRLLTLTGAGGVGKTRLARELAATQVSAYPDGVHWVNLAPLGDPARVARTVTGVLGVREVTGQTTVAALLSALRDKQLLLVLDNCEHLIEACAELIDCLLKGSPGARVLATGREPLRLAGETLYRVPCLSLPPVEAIGAAGLLDSLRRAEAVELFMARAAAARPDFVLTERNALAVDQICRRLDGVPLAIELAAARVRTVSVDQIVPRLNDRFRLLTGGSRTALPRQQTLRATIDWSHDLLTEPERIVLRRLAVFAGGWTAEAAEAVCADEGIEREDVFDLLARLVDKSLVQVDDGDVAEGRFCLLETVRQYGLDRLRGAGEEQLVRVRHRDWCLALAEQAGPGLRGPDQGAWLARLEVEHENLRVALGWAEDSPEDARIGLRLAAALWRFWDLHNHLSEGRVWLARRLAAAGAEPGAARAAALVGLGMLATRQGDYAVGIASQEEAQAIFLALGDESARAQALACLGFAQYMRGDQGAARASLEESQALARQTGDRWALGEALHYHGHVLLAQADPKGARAIFEESLKLFRAEGDSWYLAQPLKDLGDFARQRGDFVAAGRLYEESLALSRAVQDRWHSADTLGRLADLLYQQGDHERAIQLGEEALQLWRQMGNRGGVVELLTLHGAAERSRGHLERARSHFEESLALARELGNRRVIANVLGHLGGVAIDAGDDEAASAQLRESLVHWRDLDAPEPIAACLEKLAGIAVRRDQAARAARLLGAADALRQVLGQTGAEPVEEATALAARRRLGEVSFRTGWATGRILPLSQVIDEVLADDEPAAPAVSGSHSPGDRLLSPLSEREQEVAGLILHGLTSRQIATELSISERTVDRHVGNILDKLGLSSRAQIAAWVVERHARPPGGAGP